MSQRFHALVLSAALSFATLWAAPAWRRWPGRTSAVTFPPRAAHRRAAEADRAAGQSAAPQHGDPKLNLDKLFEALKIAPSDESAKFVENRIWRSARGRRRHRHLLMAAASRPRWTARISISRSSCSMPSSTSARLRRGLERRATAFYMKKDFANALVDIRECWSRAAPFRGAVGARHDHAGAWRRQARARGFPPRDRGASASLAHSRAGQEADRDGRGPRDLILSPSASVVPGRHFA